MNWSSMWTGFIGAVVGSGLVQAYLNHRFSQKLEQFKTTLSRELFEHQTKFAWFYTERAKTLVDLYSLLATMHEAFVGLLQPIQQGGEEATERKVTAAMDAAQAFSGFWIKKLVFFDEDLILKLERVNKEYMSVWSTYAQRDLAPTPAQAREAWREGWEKLVQNVMPLLPEIQHKIQDMLGGDK